MLISMTRHSLPEGKKDRASSADVKAFWMSFQANERGCQTWTLKYGSNLVLPLVLITEKITETIPEGKP